LRKSFLFFVESLEQGQEHARADAQSDIPALVITVAELVVALQELRRRYDGEWLIERLGFRTPGQARRDLAAAGCGAGPTCCRVG
jgi:hypothetical protein